MTRQRFALSVQTGSSVLCALGPPVLLRMLIPFGSSGLGRAHAMQCAAPLGAAHRVMATRENVKMSTGFTGWLQDCRAQGLERAADRWLSEVPWP